MILFIASFVLLLGLDYIWLSFVVRGFNERQLAPIARMADGHIAPDKIAAIVAYLAMALATTFGWGALMGACLYGVTAVILSQISARLA